jgi:curved DNA-binding protein CbpA
MEIPLKGNIKDVSLVRILVYLNRHRKTGTLTLSTPVFTKNIYINSGDAIFASSTYEDDRLGEMLLKADKITVEQYDKSVEILKSSRKRQGAILVELGYISPKDLFWGVKYQVKEIIHSMFQIEDAAYEFEEGDIPTQEVITLKMSMGNLIYEGIKKIENWTRIRKEMPDTQFVLKLSNDPLTLFQDVELSSRDKKILAMVNGRKTIKEIIEHSWMGSFEALKILYVLWSLGIVEQTTAIPAGLKAEKKVKEEKEETVSLSEILQPLSEEEESFGKKVDALYTGLKSMRPHELLEIDKESDSDTVKKNYYRLTKEFHPDRYFAIPDESIKTKLTAIFDAVTGAYDALKDEKKRQDFFRSLRPVKKTRRSAEQAKTERQFRLGIEEFKKGNFHGAADHFREAARVLPEGAHYWNYLSLAYSRIPGKIKEAEQALIAAIKLEPRNADYYANLGLIYIRAGQKKKARSSFEKALKIDAENEKAIKGLEQTAE